MKTFPSPVSPRRVALIAALVVGTFACGDDAMRALGDAMADAARDARDITLDAAEDVGDAMADSGQVEAQTCLSCARQFEVIARFPVGTPIEPFRVSGFDRFHVASTTSCGFRLQARFGEDWIEAGAFSPPSGGTVYSFEPVADEYRLSNVQACTYVVQGERNNAR